MNIGKAMQEIREERKLSRREMAEQLGCTQTSLWKIETGKVWPKNTTIDKFCQKTFTPPARLIFKSITEEDFFPEWVKHPILKIGDEIIGRYDGDGKVLYQTPDE